ncbi:MAG: redoxin domain-containing protein [Deltaproteobacteria bacterium]|nr:redoxin domain-containing protein [Deltaproteobacteria bacterium]
MKKLVIIFAVVLLPSLAFAFPFRNVEQGEKIPSVQLQKVDGGSFSLSPSTVKGKGLILLFWGADTAVKKKRAIEILEILNGVAESYEEIKVVAINAQKNRSETIHEVISQVNPQYPVLLDEGHDAYNAFGLFVVPSILVVNGEGLVKTGFGYSNTIEDKIDTEVLLLLGKISEQEAKAKLTLEITSAKSNQEIKALQHLRLGVRMENMQMLDKAKEEYARAVGLFELAEAYIRLGALRLEEGDLEGAEKDINKGLALDPDALDAKIAYARLRVAKGDLEGVVEDLQMLSFMSPKNHVLHYAIGNGYEAKGEFKNAIKEYKKAYDFLKRRAMKQ